MSDMRWGIVATIKAPLAEALSFAAWHLEQGAHRLFIYLDEAAPETEAALASHPRIRVTTADAAWWARKGRRPDTHQVRQSRNARHAYRRASDVEWLGHIDVDEFVMPREGQLAEHLAALPADIAVARIRPVEALAPGDGTSPDETAFKAFHLDSKARQNAAERIFPTWGPYLSGGFLSHVAGKVFVRTGMDKIEIRIHNAFQNGERFQAERELPHVELGHLHAKSWDDWIAHLRFRLERGSYRAELNPPVRNNPEAVNLHTLFSYIQETEGEAGLHAFYEEVCLAGRDLCQKLEAEGLLRRRDMQLDYLRKKHFPGSTD